jgi:hypothetical protein
MDPTLISACEMFLVPATILFAALSVANTEQLKTLVSLMGLVTSGVWLTQVWLWQGLSRLDQGSALALAGIFTGAWLIALVAHGRLWHSQTMRADSSVVPAPVARETTNANDEPKNRWDTIVYGLVYPGFAGAMIFDAFDPFRAFEFFEHPSIRILRFSQLIIGFTLAVDFAHLYCHIVPRAERRASGRVKAKPFWDSVIALLLWLSFFCLALASKLEIPQPQGAPALIPPWSFLDKPYLRLECLGLLTASYVIVFLYEFSWHVDWKWQCGLLLPALLSFTGTVASLLAQFVFWPNNLEILNWLVLGSTLSSFAVYFVYECALAKWGPVTWLLERLSFG